MTRTIADLTLTVLAITSMSCLISLMAIFIGGGQGGTDLRGLVYLQAGVTPIALGISMICFYGFVRRLGLAMGTRAMWRAIPQWMVFIFLLLNSLVMSGEVAFAIVMRATEKIIVWQQHIPLVCMLVCSSAYLALYARVNSYPGSPAAMSGRWTSS